MASSADPDQRIATLELYDLLGNGFDHRGVGPFEQALDRLAGLVGGDRAFLLITGRGLSDTRTIVDTHPEMPMLDPTTHAEVLESIVSHGVADLVAEPDGAAARLLNAIGAARAVAAPVLADAESAGMLVVTNVELGERGSLVHELVAGVAARLGRIIGRRLVYAELLELVEHERVTRSITESIRASLDPRVVAETAAQELRSFLDAGHAAVGVLEPGTGRIQLAAEQVGENMPTLEGETAEFLDGIFLRPYLATERVLVVDDTLVDLRCVDHRDAFLRLGARAALLVPLSDGGRVIGAIGTFQSTPRRWTPGQIAIAEGVGAQTAVGLRQARMHSQLDAALREAQFTSRLKDDFLATVSHELRTPLVAILGWAEMLADPESPPSRADIAAGIASIQKAGSTLHQLIEDLLDLSQIVRNQMVLDREPLNLNVAVRSAVDILASLAVRKQLVLEVQTAEYPLTVDADPLRLEQVLWNLLANAIKFTPEGGTVKVYTRRENGWAHTIVEDTGLGIDPNFLPYVFDRFRQQDSSFTRRHGGLGIGMSIAKSIAELHGGDLLVESGGKWKGSRFTLRLPISLRRATGHLTGDLLTEKGRELLAAFESQVSEPAGVQNGVRTVIVVDATGQCAILVSQILGRYGYRVHSTASPSRAVELAVDEGAMAVLVDAEVDDSSATCVAESMRNAGVTTPALIIVDGRDRGKLERARRDGYAGYLDKPIRRTELLETLEQIVSRQG